MKGWPLVRKLLSLSAALLLSSCSGLGLVQQLPQIDEMTPEALTAYADDVAWHVGAVAEAAVTEGDLTIAQISKAADILDALAAGTLTAGTLEVEVKGYSALALALAFHDLDKTLGAVISENDKVVITTVSKKLRDISGVQPSANPSS